MNVVNMLSQPYIILNTWSQKAGAKMWNYMYRQCMQGQCNQLKRNQGLDSEQHCFLQKTENKYY